MVITSEIITNYQLLIRFNIDADRFRIDSHSQKIVTNHFNNISYRQEIVTNNFDLVSYSQPIVPTHFNIVTNYFSIVAHGREFRWKILPKQSQNLFKVVLNRFNA